MSGVASTRPTAWPTIASESFRSKALEAALLIARRATDSQQVEVSLARAVTQTRFPATVTWTPWSVAQGDAGQALLCARLHQLFAVDGWDEVGREHLARAAHAVSAAQVPTGAVSGCAGLLFIARLIEHNDLTWMVPGLRARTSESALAMVAAMRGRNGLEVSAFDVISGLSGILACLLPVSDGDEAPPLVPFLVRALVELATTDGEPEPWHTPPELLYDDEQRQMFPAGNINCGLAHGIPGPLAALSLASLTGQVERAAVAPAVTRLATWLTDHATTADDGLAWPTVIPLRRVNGALRSVTRAGAGRDAWCYGTPGVARALFLAGSALEVPAWRETAIEAMAGVYQRSPAARFIDSPTFCHGVAGLLQITVRFLRDTGLPMFAEQAEALTEQILASVDPERPMGIANIEPDGTPVDSPGLLDGAAGTSLALLSVATGPEPTWDRLFALA